MDQAKVFVVGRLSRDPEFKDEGTEKQRALFSIASNRGRGDNRKASFFDCIAWGKRADIMRDFRTGSGIFVTGDLEQDTYTNKEDQKRNRVQINVSSITATTKIRRPEGEGGVDTPSEVRVGGGSEEAPIPF